MPTRPLQMVAEGSNGAPGTLVEQIMVLLRRRIAARTLPPGARLPSIRRLAGTMRVSTSTVIEAYDRLVAEGEIVSRRGSGFFVSARPTPLALAEIAPPRERAVDPFWVSRLSLEADEATLKPGCGWLPASWMPQDAIRRALRRLARGGEGPLADYGTPLGSPPLRRLLSLRMAEHGIEATPSQIVLTDSGTQAIDLLCRLLIEPGDTVLVDDPCYFNFHALLRAHRAEVVGVPFTPSGPDVDALGATLEAHRPRLYITNSALQNPTGATLSPVTAHRVLKLAEKHELTIIEDDIFADFEHEPAPRLGAFDGFERVVHIGSFSKTLSAAARCGYIAARHDWVEQLIDLKIATSFGGGHMAAELLLAILQDGSYRKHIEALRTRLAQATAQVMTRLSALGIEPWIEPRGGMFLWCRLPGGADAAELAREALGERIVLAPGNVFSLSRSAGSFMRFNTAQSTHDRLYTFLTKALRTGKV